MKSHAERSVAFADWDGSSRLTDVPREQNTPMVITDGVGESLVVTDSLNGLGGHL